MPFEEWYNLFYLSEALKINLSSGGKYYIEGSPVTIDCEASGNPLPDVAWIRNGVVESSGKKSAFLKFYNINRTDAGQYTCRANNSVEVTSIDTSIVVYCKYVLTLIFYYWIYFIHSTIPVIRVSYTKLMNHFKSVRRQNSTSNPFGLCVHWFQVMVGRLNFCGIIAHIILLRLTWKIFYQVIASVGLCWTQEMASSHFWVIVITQNSLCLTSTQSQGVKLHLIQVSKRLNLSLWRPNFT